MPILLCERAQRFLHNNSARQGFSRKSIILKNRTDLSEKVVASPDTTKCSETYEKGREQAECHIPEHIFSRAER